MGASVSLAPQTDARYEDSGAFSIYATAVLPRRGASGQLTGWLTKKDKVVYTAKGATPQERAPMQALRATAWLGSYLIRPSAKRGLHGGARARHRLRTKASSSLHAVAAPLRLRRGAALRARILRAMTREPHTTTAYLATPEAALSAILLPAAAWATASRLSTQPSSVHLSSAHPLPWSQCFELHKTKFG